MADQLQHKNSTDGDEATLPAEFIAVCVLAFVASVSATVYFCRSMCCEMEMPGGWTMSMMWMRMHGQTWFGSATSFLLMWLAMMVAMMLPSALPMLLRVRNSLAQNGNRNPGAPAISAASGYFFVWLVAGAAVYVFGVAFASAAMRFEWVSRMTPALSGGALVAAGAMQFTDWKMSALRRCRDPLCCAALGNCAPLTTGWDHGLKQGVSCFVCCAAPMLVLLALGTMNLLVMILVAATIAMEKLMPRPEPLVRLFGIAAIVIGLAVTIHGLPGH